MRTIVKSITILLGTLVSSLSVAAPGILPRDAYKSVQSGTAYLIDVRELAEIQEAGMAAPASWLATTEISAQGPKYKQAIESWDKNKAVIFYCRSGNRSGKAADHFAGLGFRTLNAGAFQSWKDAGLPLKAAPTNP